MTDTADVPTLRVRGPADLAQAVPYLLGFHPSCSFVLVGLRNGRVAVAARTDLADLAEPALLEGTVSAMRAGGAETFVGLVFDDTAVPNGRNPDSPLPWRGAAAEFASAVEAAGAEVDDVALVSSGRLWCYGCEEQNCCPPEGRVLDECSPVVAEATYAGLVALPDRASLAGRLDPTPDRDQLWPLLDEAERATVEVIVRGELAQADRLVTRALCAAARAADTPGQRAELSDADVVRFGIALQRIKVRDRVWMAVDNNRFDGRPLWCELARRLPAPYDAPALFLFGWRSWRAGDGAMAGIAAERAIASDPRYSAADMLLAAVTRAVDPRTVPRLRPPKPNRKSKPKRKRPR